MYNIVPYTLRLYLSIFIGNYIHVRGSNLLKLLIQNLAFDRGNYLVTRRCMLILNMFFNVTCWCWTTNTSNSGNACCQLFIIQVSYLIFNMVNADGERWITKESPQKIVTATIKEMNKTGRPRKRWTDEVKEFSKIMGLENWQNNS